jgi:hypothetical protein
MMTYWHQITIATLLSLCSLTLAQSNDLTPCYDLLTTFSTCESNNPSSQGSVAETNQEACTACLLKQNFFTVYSPDSSCDEVKSEICNFLNICNGDCFPNYGDCQQEYNNYSSCIYGAIYAPENCVVQCDGSSGGGSGSGSNNINTTNKGSGGGLNSSTSNSTGKSYILNVLSGMISTILVTIALAHQDY